MKKKVLKVLAFIIATAGVIFLLLLYNSFNGNFIAKEIATRHMKEYLKTHHTELDIRFICYENRCGKQYR